MARKGKQKAYSSSVSKEGMSLGERLSVGAMGNVTHSGRGHGRSTQHGRGKRAANQPTRREMLYFVRDTVRSLREAPASQLPHSLVSATTHDFANTLARGVQFFDCSELTDYIESNYYEMYPDRKVPPSPKVILPAPAVGLYVNNWPDADPYTREEDGTFGEVMFVCMPRLNDGSTTNFSITALTRNIDHGIVEPFPKILGTINSEKGEFGISPKSTRSEGIRESESLRIVAAFLQTINNPRFVRRGKKTFSQMKKTER